MHMFDMFGNHLNCTVAHNLILKTQLANNKCLLSVGKKGISLEAGVGYYNLSLVVKIPQRYEYASNSLKLGSC
jgi:hypothetical protein